MNANLAALLYLVSGVLFIMALRGLSSPATSRQGNIFGMVGMGIAIATTLALANVPNFATWALIALSLVATAAVGRALFYVLVIPTTMPGAFFWKNPAFQDHARGAGLAEMQQVGVQIVRH